MPEWPFCESEALFYHQTSASHTQGTLEHIFEHHQFPLTSLLLILLPDDHDLFLDRENFGRGCSN